MLKIYGICAVYKMGDEYIYAAHVITRSASPLETTQYVNTYVSRTLIHLWNFSNIFICNYSSMW